MSHPVNVVVTCTKRKSVAVPESSMLRRVPKASIARRVELWQERLHGSASEPVVVRELYAGDHWSIARSLENVGSHRGGNIRLWVASAGYGLVSINDRIKAYSATFSSSHPDSIPAKTTGTDRRAICQDWWNLMARWDRRAGGGPRTISELAAESPHSPLVIIASDNYLAAITADVRCALASLADIDLLTVFSAGCKSLEGLDGHLVPYDARLQRIVGGALRSLNVRVARKVVVECRRSPPTLPVLRKNVAALAQGQPPLQRPDRQPMTDSDVQTFIARRLRTAPATSHTQLLRRLRAEGKACEQKRFSRLYREVQERLNVP